VALEYRVGDRLHGIEFMTLGADGRVSFGVGNDVLPSRPRLLNQGHKGPRAPVAASRLGWYQRRPCPRKPKNRKN
jgi:hypothetical protein